MGRYARDEKFDDKNRYQSKTFITWVARKTSNNSIKAIDILESFWVSIWIGCFRFSHTAVVRLDEVLRQIFGWKRVPSETTYGRFFKKFTLSMNHEIFIELYRWFFEQI